MSGEIDMATKLEKSHVDGIRKAREENDDFNLAVQLDILYSNIEESSFRLLLDQIGLGYRKGRYLVGIIEDTVRLDYPFDDVQSLMIGVGWTKTSIILRSLAHKKSVSNLIKHYRNKTVPELRKDFPSPEAKSTHSTKKQFAAFLPEKRHKKLLRILEKEYGLVKTTGKRKGVSEAFGKLINDL